MKSPPDGYTFLATVSLSLVIVVKSSDRVGLDLPDRIKDGQAR